VKNRRFRGSERAQDSSKSPPGGNTSATSRGTDAVHRTENRGGSAIGQAILHPRAEESLACPIAPPFTPAGRDRRSECCKTRPGRSSTAARFAPGANGVVELTPLEFLDRLADLVPPPRKHRHRYHGVFAPNHKLRRAVTALAIGNIGKRREAATGGHAGNARVTDGCCDTPAKPRSHDTSRIAWAKLMARVGEEFPLECPACGGDIRLIAFITEPGPIRKILTHLGEPLEPPPVSPARGPPTDWGELVQVHDDRHIFQGPIDELPAIDIHSL
jgi:hypothetical protein